MSATGSTILIVEDDPDIASALQRGLESHGFATRHEDRVGAGLEALRESEVAAGILDVMIGDESGLDLVADARREGITKPILMLSALAEVEDRARGIEAGADDYIVKPFAFDELLARLQVQVHRLSSRAGTSFRLERETRTVIGPQGEVELTEREFQMLEVLTREKGRVVSRWDLFDALWGEGEATSDNVVDVYVGYLRKKLQPVEAFGIEIKTIRNKGFMLVGGDGS